MGIKLLDSSCKYTLLNYLISNEWYLKDFDTKSKSLVCYTNRNGRTDDEIDESARTARVAISVILTLMTGMQICPGLRYTVEEN